MTKAESLVNLRPAGAGEGALLLEITRAAIAGLAKDFYSPAQLADWTAGRMPDYYEQAIARGGVTVATDATQVLGFVDAAPGIILRLYVRPEMARHGIGGRLLAAGLEQAMKDHAGPVRVDASLNAAPFYARHGFREVGRGTWPTGSGQAPAEIVHMLR